MRIGKILKKECLKCKNIFLTYPCHFDRRKYCSYECGASMTKNRWKGDDVGYIGLHKWVSKYLGKPQVCEFCHKNGLVECKIHWANKSHLYKRDLSDWIRLCVPCHKKYDTNKF